MSVRGEVTVAQAFSYAVAQYEAGAVDQATAICQKILEAIPAHTDALLLSATLLAEGGHLDEAISRLDLALPNAANQADILNNRGNLLRRRGDLSGALQSYSHALDKSPGHAVALNNRGVVHFTLQQFEAAIADLNQAIANSPDYPEALFNRGNALRESGRFDEALRDYEHAIAARPDYPEAHLGRGSILLLRRQFAEGWLGYEWRRRIASFWRDRSVSRPEWDGIVRPGMSLLLYSEQGLGDCIQFARFAVMLADRGMRVTLEVDRLLVRLLSRLRNVTVVSRGDPIAPQDAECPLMSVPLLIRATERDLRCATPYLAAEADRLDHWNGHNDAAGLRIGLAWSGAEASRSIPVEALEELASVRGVSFFSLQRDPDGHGVPSPPGFVRPIPSLDEGADAFLDTAAVMMHLDLVITCDTSVAHLAGALGRPVWVMLRSVSDWRWFEGSTRTVWYPTARLFRQGRNEDWRSVIAAVATALTGLAGVQATNAVLVPTGIGEIVDKITILEIKQDRIPDPAKVANVRVELGLLRTALARAVGNPHEIHSASNRLREINVKLWDIEDELRVREDAQDFGPEFVALARQVYKINDQRAAVKREINAAAGSAIIEEKSYR